MNPQLTPRIETDRTLLELPRYRDAAAMLRFRIDNRERLAKWEPKRDAGYYSLTACRTRIRMSRRDFRRGTVVHFLVWQSNRAQERIIAECAFTNIVRGVFQACHLGFAVDREHEGTGVMREAVAAAIRYMFDEVGIHRIMANYMPQNARSEKLLKSLGFQREGYARRYLRISGRWEDHVLTSLLNPDPR